MTSTDNLESLQDRPVEGNGLAPSIQESYTKERWQHTKQELGSGAFGTYDDWQGLFNDFAKLSAEQSRLLQDKAMSRCLYGHGEYGQEWRLVGDPGLKNAFRGIAARAGLQLRPTEGPGRPADYWMHLLFLYMQEEVRSPDIVTGGEPGRPSCGTVKEIVGASRDFCNWIATQIVDSFKPLPVAGSQTANQTANVAPLGLNRRARKGDATLLDGNEYVSASAAEQYVGVGRRRLQALAKDRVIETVGTAKNRQFSVASLKKYQPPLT